MELKDKIVVVTGAASGIGRALCLRFAKAGSRAVVVSDINIEGMKETVAMIGDDTAAIGIPCNVGKEQEVSKLVDETLMQFKHIDLFCSNAGIYTIGDENVLTADWQSIWDINVMAHVFAARAVLPGMLARGEGYLLNTSSAAGLLSAIGSAPYSVTKHAAIGFAEWLSITYGKRGIRVSALCPQAVRTPMAAGSEEGGVAGIDGMLEPEQLAESVVETLTEERFLVLPHPEVLTYIRRKTDDYDRWLGGMQRLHERFADSYKERAERTRQPDTTAS